MGFELIHYLNATPHRVYAALALLQQVKKSSRQELMQLLRPHTSGGTEYSAAIENLVYFELAQKDGSAQLVFSLTSAGAAIQSLEEFRTYMQGHVLGATSEEQDNYLLNLFTAWYAAQDQQVLTWGKSEYENRFHRELFPASPKRPLSDNPDLNAWQLWAEFLGWGWTVRLGGERRVIPDATLRIRPLLPTLLSNDSAIPFGEFIRTLSAICPELDGGTLYQRAWNASHPDEPRGNRVSLMLSTALRVLERSNELEMIDRADATQMWTLFPAQSYATRVTHIARKAPL